ncbi:hypothetical protein PQJ75_19225 [Rhodoplanes sp. TEM]|uniref:Poly(3-hydroxyalkanoate) polymerase subunit PhaE n=1 Tax=Rhodoplanes tepidamans TaxID=200616 RepID=A0ABT5JJG4_RHOTP|nr:MULTISPECIES: hypothetical protein [Rhodoplanes]MDC7789719.1 hypothetical protein [Rhodoplanes tepidamans]MDC7985868.1 hypothetical protein [Rhodoplanes sp. TEM]MDQ0354396.1 hypothetical protein [Rhodoplanes tepidamans]
MEGRYFEHKKIAEMLRGALAEMAVLCAEQTPSTEAVEHVERWTLRWIDLVEAMIWNTPPGADVDELRAALAQLRAMAPAMRARADVLRAPAIAPGV